jgi:hypothetical protein
MGLHDIIKSEARREKLQDSKQIAFFCPAAHGAAGIDLCNINADDTERMRLALNV